MRQNGQTGRTPAASYHPITSHKLKEANGLQLKHQFFNIMHQHVQNITKTSLYQLRVDANHVSEAANMRKLLLSDEVEMRFYILSKPTHSQTKWWQRHAVAMTFFRTRKPISRWSYINGILKIIFWFPKSLNSLT